MNKNVIASLLACCGAFTVQAADLATVNGKPITQSQVDFILKDAAAQGRKIDDNVRATIVEKLINTELINQEAQNSGIDKQPDFMMKAELAMRELRINAYVEDFIRKNPVDEKAMQAEYDKLKSQAKGKEYKAGHILVKTEEEARSIIAQLAKGTDFGSIAKEKSEDPGSKGNGGDLGWFQPEGMVKPFGDAVVTMQKGSYSTTPVQTEFGWHVIRLEDSRDMQPPAYDAVKNQIHNDLQRKQLDKLINDLRAKATIVNNMSSTATK